LMISKGDTTKIRRNPHNHDRQLEEKNFEEI
jgi:hypothetical protein